MSVAHVQNNVKQRKASTQNKVQNKVLPKEHVKNHLYLTYKITSQLQRGGNKHL